MTAAAALLERRARLKLVLSEPAESEAIARILKERLRLRRERRIAKARRQAYRAKEVDWVDAKDVLKDASNPNDLIKALRSGAVDCLFVNPARWWLPPWTVPLSIWESVQFTNGQLWRNAVRIEGPHQQLVVNKRQWLECLGQPAAPVSSADVTPQVSAIHSQGGRPTDKDRVIAEARRRIGAAESLPVTLTEFAGQLHTWLDAQPDARRTKKSGKVLQPETIEDHVRPIWQACRGKGAI
jgi:hypothetical protein